MKVFMQIRFIEGLSLVDNLEIHTCTQLPYNHKAPNTANIKAVIRTVWCGQVRHLKNLPCHLNR